MYSGASLGFRRRWYFSLRRSSVKSRKSRKLVIVKFVLIVTRNPRCLSRFVKSILMRSASLSDVLLKTARPSSWPSPGFHWQLGEGKQSYKFTSFCAVFAPHCNVKHSVAILLRPDFLITKERGTFESCGLHGCHRLRFRHVVGRNNALFERLSDMDGQYSTMSKLLNVQSFFAATDSNHSSTFAEFFHSVTSIFSRSFWLMWSRMFFLTMPFSFLAALISRQPGGCFGSYHCDPLALRTLPSWPYLVCLQCGVCWP